MTSLFTQECLEPIKSVKQALLPAQFGCQLEHWRLPHRNHALLLSYQDPFLSVLVWLFANQALSFRGLHQLRHPQLSRSSCRGQMHKWSWCVATCSSPTTDCSCCALTFIKFLTTPNVARSMFWLPSAGECRSNCREGDRRERRTREACPRSALNWAYATARRISEGAPRHVRFCLFHSYKNIVNTVTCA